MAKRKPHKETEWVNVKKYAALKGIAVPTVYKQMHAGKLTYDNQYGLILIKVSKDK